MPDFCCGYSSRYSALEEIDFIYKPAEELICGAEEQFTIVDFRSFSQLVIERALCDRISGKPKAILKELLLEQA